MKFIILPLGIPTSGKTTFINESSLSHHVISRDKIKEMFFGSTVEDGNITRSRYSSNKTYTMNSTKKIYSMALNNRMQKGDLIVLDETNCILDKVKNILFLCSAYQYTPLFIDFDIDLPQALMRNSARQGTISYAPPEIIVNMYESKKEVLSYLNKSGYTIHNKNEFYNGDAVISYLSQEVFDKNLELNAKINTYFDKVYVIGDIQGCYDKLKSFMDEHYNPDNFYIFTGDYTDRGDKNKETIQYLCKLAKANNTQFLLGNHEGYVMQWLSQSNKPTNHKQFNDVTLKEIENIDKNQLKSFYKKCLDFIRLERNGKTYIISHGGVTKTFLEGNVVTVPSDYYWRGEGEYDDNTSLTLQTKDVIIHGHRNKHHNPIQVGNVVNLECRIEFGGELGYYII